MERLVELLLGLWQICVGEHPQQVAKVVARMEGDPN